MPRSTSMVELGAALVLDASVVINLNACGAGVGARLLATLPRPALMAVAAIEDVKVDARTGRDDAAMLLELIEAGLVDPVPMRDDEWAIFGDLVVGDGPDTLDDGEAATIAVAVTRGAVAVLDEAKARRLLAVRHPITPCVSTVDLLAHPSVVAVAGNQLGDWLFNALQTARMRVLPHRHAWVIENVGIQRAAQCSSLPAHVVRAFAKSATYVGTSGD